MSVQYRIAEYVKENGIKQAWISEKTGLNPRIISETLSGKRTMTADEYELICLALKKTPNNFMTVFVPENQS